VLFDSPSQFFHAETGDFVFPFTLTDPAPGGANLGRIEWIIEPIFANGRVVKMYLSAAQTRDLRYAGKFFEIAMNCPAIGTRRAGLNVSGSFFQGVWLLGHCKLHNATFMRSYPPDDAVELVIDAKPSTIMSLVYWRCR
jgi:hypothetical protein